MNQTFEATQDAMIDAPWRPCSPPEASRKTSSHSGERRASYRAIDPPRSLEYTSKYENDKPIPELTTIRFDFESASDGKTRLRVTHSGFESAEMRDMHHAAWVQIFGR